MPDNPDSALIFQALITPEIRTKMSSLQEPLLREGARHNNTSTTTTDREYTGERSQK